MHQILPSITNNNNKTSNYSIRKVIKIKPWRLISSLRTSGIKLTIPHDHTLSIKSNLTLKLIKSKQSKNKNKNKK